MVGIVRSISFGLLLLALGCSAPSTWTGTWVGYRSIKAGPGQDPNVARQISKVAVRLHKNGRFELVEGTMPQEGFFKLEGDKAVLTVKQAAKHKVSEETEITLEKKEDGTLTYTNPAGLSPTPVVLAREAQREG